MKPRNIELRIEELVFHGLAPVDRYRISGAVESELVRLFVEQGIPPSLAQGLETAGLDGGAFHVAPDSRSATIGVQVAQAVYGGLST